MASPPVRCPCTPGEDIRRFFKQYVFASRIFRVVSAKPLLLRPNDPNCLWDGQFTTNREITFDQLITTANTFRPNNTRFENLKYFGRVNGPHEIVIQKWSMDFVLNECEEQVAHSNFSLNDAVAKNSTLEVNLDVLKREFTAVGLDVNL